MVFRDGCFGVFKDYKEFFVCVVGYIGFGNGDFNVFVKVGFVVKSIVFIGICFVN